MIDRFTAPARNAMNLAHGGVRTLRHDYFGAEHLLLGLIADPGCAAVGVLQRLGVDAVTLRAALLERFPARPLEESPNKLPFTPDAKSAFELALDEAIRLGHSFMDTGHLLLGLLSVRESLAAEVLRSAGAELDDARELVLQLAELEQPPPFPEAHPWAGLHEGAVIAGVLGREEARFRRGRARVLVPRGPRFDALFAEALAPALAAHDFEVQRGVDIADPGGLLKRECSAFRSAELLVAVLAGRDPYIYYQLGLCHGMRRSPILVVERPQDLPFDLLELPRVEYEDSESGRRELRDRLAALIATVHRRPPGE